MKGGGQGRIPEPGAPDVQARNRLARCLEGDEAAWNALYREHAPRIARYLRTLLGSPGDVDDLVQQVFVEMLAHLREFRGEGGLTTWTYGIATNVAARHRRGEYRWWRRREAWEEWADGEPAVPGPEASIDARRTWQWLEGVLGTIDFRYRVVWTMRELEGLTYDEIAVALDLNIGTVRSRLFVAREKVMEALKAAGLDPAAGGRGQGVVTLLGRAPEGKRP